MTAGARTVRPDAAAGASAAGPTAPAVCLARMFDAHRGRRRSAVGLTLYTDAFVDARHRSRRASGGSRTSSTWPTTVPRPVGRDLRRVRRPAASRSVPSSPRSTSPRSCSRSPTSAVEPRRPSCGRPRRPKTALISVPPFQVIGSHPPPARARPARGARRADRRFLPVTDATYWSDTLGEARADGRAASPSTTTRAQILAPHQEVDPWAGSGDGAAPATGRHPDRADRLVAA